MKIEYLIKWHFKDNPSMKGKGNLSSDKVTIIQWKNYGNNKYSEIEHIAFERIYGDLRDMYIERPTDDYQHFGNYKVIIK